jgi:paraquat-inducible protein A
VSSAPFARQMQVCRCSLCGLVCEDDDSADIRQNCPRCHTPLPKRTSVRASRSGALLTASMVLYVPPMFFR